MHPPLIAGPVGLAVAAVGIVAYLVVRRSAHPEAFMLFYSTVLTLAVSGLLAYLVLGAVSTGGRQQGSLIGQAIIVGCGAIALVVATTRIAARYRAGRRS